MDDQDQLAGVDLSAWEVPPPAPGLADAVVRRMREPQVVPTQRSLRMWLAGAGVLAAVVAVLAVILWGIERAPADGGGAVDAARAAVLDLGRSSATLDAGANVSWTRRGPRLTAQQPRGAATWTVSSDDTLVIDAGATVASIEASGARLRVEVEMNRSDVRAIAVGSASAVVVALVTVIVYEGHVRATHHGQTVTIQPGTTLQVPTPEAPPPPEQLTVGGSPGDAQRIQFLESEVQRLQQELSARELDTRPTKTEPDKKVADKPTCDEVSCVLNNYEGACCAKYKKCDAAALAKAGDALLGSIEDARALAKYEASLACKADSAVVKKAYLAACRVKNQQKAQSYYDQMGRPGAAFSQICLRYGIAIDDTPCDATPLKKKGEDYLSNGMDTAALAQFEAALRCKFETATVKKAFIAACRSKQEKKAREMYKHLPPEDGQYAQICLRFGIAL